MTDKGITVARAIELLQQCPPDKLIRIENKEHAELYAVRHIEYDSAENRVLIVEWDS